MKKALFNIGGIVVQLVGLAWAGLRVRPAAFPPVDQSNEFDAIAVPGGLPAPVERLYRDKYGERIPVVGSGVISGRGRMRLFGITFPLRFRFMHEAARNFRAYFELTLFGVPIMKVNEHFVGGKFRQELPMGVEEEEPKNDHSAAIRMWAEWVLWLPAMLLTDPDVRWEAVDDSMALLVVPVGETEERLVVRFDETTGKVQYVEGMKYKYPKETSKTLWVNAVWFGERPWAEFDIEEVALNAHVDTSPEVKGPLPASPVATGV